MQCRTCGRSLTPTRSRSSPGRSPLSDPLLSDPLYCTACCRNITNQFQVSDRIRYMQRSFFDWLNHIWQLIDRLGRWLEPIGVVFLTLYFMGAKVLPPAGMTAMKAGSYLIVLLLLISAGRVQRSAYVITRDFLVLLIIAIAFISVEWSAAPFVSSDEIKALLRLSVYGMYLAIRYTPKQLMYFFAWTLAIAACLSFVYGAALPEGSHIVDGNDVWRGVFGHKQYLGLTMTISTPLFILLGLENPRYRRRWFIFAFIAFVNVLFTQSKSSLIGLLFGLSLIPFSKIVRQNYKVRTAITAFIFLLVFYVVLIISVNAETILVDILDKGTDLNGRVPIWKLCFEIMSREPGRFFTGFGYSGFWPSKYGHFVIENSWAGTIDSVRNGGRFHAHSGFVDIFMQLGFIGLIPLVMSLFSTISRVALLMVTRKEPEYLWMMQFILVSCMYNFVEIPTYVSNHPFWSFYITIVLMSRLQLQQKPEPQPMQLPAQNLPHQFTPLEAQSPLSQPPLNGYGDPENNGNGHTVGHRNGVSHPSWPSMERVKAGHDGPIGKKQPINTPLSK